MPWFFKDQSSKIQGPFEDAEMRAWYESGYLTMDLPISKDVRQGFKPLSEVFPSSTVAFLPEEDVKRLAAAGANEPGQWYFMDQNDEVQGPFSDINMREWYVAGYFEPDLQIMSASVPGSDWTSLSDAFPNLDQAFLVLEKGFQGIEESPEQDADDKRFQFAEWLPAPPRFKGTKKEYPSAKNSSSVKHHIALTDVHGRSVQTLGQVAGGSSSDMLSTSL